MQMEALRALHWARDNVDDSSRSLAKTGALPLIDMWLSAYFLWLKL